MCSFSVWGIELVVKQHDYSGLCLHLQVSNTVGREDESVEDVRNERSSNDNEKRMQWFGKQAGK